MRDRTFIAGLTAAVAATLGLAFTAAAVEADNQDQQSECVTCAVESTTQEPVPSSPTEEAEVPENIDPSEVPTIVAAVDIPQPNYTTAVEQPAAPAPIENAPDIEETDVETETSTVAPEPEWGSNERPIPVRDGYNTSIVDGEPVYTPRTTAAPEPVEPEGQE